MASDATPIRTGGGADHALDSTVYQVPQQAYPHFKSGKGATAVSSFCSFRRLLSTAASIIFTVILTVIIVIVVRRASSGKDLVTGAPASPSPAPLSPSGPGPKSCQIPASTPKPGFTVLDRMLTASGVEDKSAESTAKSWTPTTLAAPRAATTPAEFKDAILLRFAEEFDPMLQATLKRLRKAAGGRRLLASNVTDTDLFATVSSFNATNGFMAPTVMAALANDTMPGLPGLLKRWYYSPFSRIIVLHARSKLGAVAHKLMQALPTGRLEFLEYSKPVYKTQTSVARPNDPNFAYQWALPKIGVVPASGTKTPAGQTPAWAYSEGSPEIVVAVFDSGVDYNHPDLQDNMWVNKDEIPGNGIDDDGNGYVDDYYGYNFIGLNSDPMDDDSHGTHCAGIIAAAASNKKGIAGVAPKVRIMALKVLDSKGVGYTDQQLLAHDYAMRMGAHITSNSYGGPKPDPALEASLGNLAKRGILFVASAGNEATNNDAVPSYPASSNHPNIISVAASDENDCFANFSNYGGRSVHLSAPGQLIISTVPGALYADQYLLMSGTSQAAPHVAAVAALVLSEMAAQGETITGRAEQVKRVILGSVRPVAGFKGFVTSGGRLDAAAALAAVQGGAAGRRRRRLGRRL